MRLALLALLVLAGCADGPPVEHGLARLSGKPAIALVNVIGTPTKQVTEGDATVYTWDTSASGTSYVPNPTMAAGFIAGTPPGMEGGAGAGATLGHEVSCEVHIRAGGDGKIKSWEFIGPETACMPVTKRLKAWANSGG